MAKIHGGSSMRFAAPRCGSLDAFDSSLSCLGIWLKFPNEYSAGLLSHHYHGGKRRSAKDARWRIQYMIAYKPRDQSVKPGYRSVRVMASAPGYRDLTVRTRSGYYSDESGH
jgi:hypothetical protein